MIVNGIELSESQLEVVTEAVEWFNHSTEQVFQYDGPPGSGKSLVLIAIVKALGLDILTEVAPMSFIGAASLVMRRNGLFNAKTAHSWLYELVNVPKRNDKGEIMYRSNGSMITYKDFRPKRTIDSHIKLIIVDEAYCMPRYMKQTVEKFGIKIIACGDSHQLPPVGDMPAYLDHGKILHLREVYRQGKRGDIIFLANQRYNREPVSVGHYGSSIVMGRSDLNDDWLLWADAIIVGTNRTRDIINNRVRYIQGFNTPLPCYGEKLVCRNNNWSLTAVTNDGVTVSLVNGLIGRVANQPSISEYDPKLGTFRLIFDYESAGCSFECNANYKYITSDHEERSKIKSIQNTHSYGQYFEYAYAITCHIAQGSQFSKVIYIEEPMGAIQPALDLVGITRAVDRLVYVKNDGIDLNMLFGVNDMLHRAEATANKHIANMAKSYNSL